MAKSVNTANPTNLTPSTRGSRFVKHMKEHWMLHLMALPAVVLVIIFAYIPMGGLVMAFQNFRVSDGIFGSEFVGFANFEFLFSGPDAWRITRNTVLYNVVFISLGTLCAVGLAIILNEMYFKKLGKVLQTIFIMPNFLSISVIALIVYAFLAVNNGFINSLLVEADKMPVSWYTTPEVWPFILVFVHIWKGTGYAAIVYLAAISGISSEYYEAAMIDGATKWQQIRFITIPCLRFVITIQLILAIGGMFRGDMGLFYNVTQNNGALYPVTDIIDTYVYRSLIALNNTGMATAAGLYQSVVGFFCILFANVVVKKFDSESALF